MSDPRFAFRWLLPLALFGCDGQQYVSPDTVELSITNNDSNLELVKRCHFIPVLLGSQIKARYRIEDERRVTVTITRDEIELDYDSGESELVTPQELENLASGEALELQSTPADYTARLTPNCTPDDFE
ncbi:MAG TPA: hypothetical protein VJN18_17465 [Polyangiaceae bacterium]|nr:hypothetical protein [Polyangiaceae bacterium]